MLKFNKNNASSTEPFKQIKCYLSKHSNSFGLSTVVRDAAKFYENINNNTIIYLFTAIGLLPGGSGYFTCKQNIELVTTKFKSGGLHEKHVVATWNVGNHLSICL